ncbi:25851_t:CDS:2, partial [Racocetra persica]
EDVADAIFELLEINKNADNLAHQQYCVRRAHNVRKIKTAMVNILGKVAIINVPGQKASKEE